MNSRLTIRARLTLLSLVGLAFVLLVGAAGFIGSHRLADLTQRITVGGAALKRQMQADQAHDALRADVLAALDAGTGSDANEKKSIRDDLEAHGKLFADSLTALDAMPIEASTRAAVEKVRPALTAYLASARQVVDKALADPAAARAGMGGFTLAFKAVEQEMEALSELIGKRAEDDESESQQAAGRVRAAILASIAASGVVLLLVGGATTASIVRPIRRAVEVAERVAAGDLTSRVEVRGHGETAQLLAALGRMNDSLATVVGTVRSSSDSIATGSSEIATGNQDLSQRTEQQASNLQQAASTMSELTTTVRHNAETTREAVQLADTACDAAAQGGSAVRQMVATIGEMSDASRRINEIVGVIDGIAFQTNILALNAAVEAARAGEQGRGFAVVATEVRTLSQRSAAAAKEIKSLIQASVETVERGSRQASDAGRTIDDIVAQVQRVTQLIGSISEATGAQTAGIGQVSDSVNQLDRVTQQNAALVEEAAAATDSLRQQARHLVDAVAMFRLADGGVPQR